MDCQFCRIEGNPEQKIIFRNELAIFTQNERLQGALKHSGVILPTVHRETVFELSDEELLASFSLLRNVKAWMDGEYKPDGYNIGWNCGGVGGQEVLHAHMHVMPRFKAEPYAGRGIRSWLKSDENRW